MFIETTFMRYGHGPGGIIGITLKESALKRWALSLHICSHLIQDIKCTRNIEEESAHPIVLIGRIFKRKFDTCIDPMNPAEHSTGVLNIVSGRIDNECVNVDDALAIGMEQMIAFENTWPEGFHSKLTNKAGTIYDTDLIYGRISRLERCPKPRTFNGADLNSGTRTGRASTQQIILTNFENKVQLIDLICEDFRLQHKLIITGSSDIPCTPAMHHVLQLPSNVQLCEQINKGGR
ncbi:hypothetical protein DPMN_183448 [Dreissena polymorpha]|uniref:Uncharacterized protein n=1 Tax=Dreissena polymorpha TaxID=45954 RepID=A0A9D4I5I8_DREPO|nr:hypothetical protein DPMN_183448 [Dreissena polymorpha]